MSSKYVIDDVIETAVILTAKTFRSELIVKETMFWIFQDFIGSVDLLELFQRFWMGIFRGMTSEGFDVIGFLEISVTDAGRNSQNVGKFGVGDHEKRWQIVSAQSLGGGWRSFSIQIVTGATVRG
jgi:hypothetical protein